jgi:hypothetical protein
VARKRAVVLRLLQGESMELLSRELGVPVYKLERLRAKAEAGLEAALKGAGGRHGRRRARRRHTPHRRAEHGGRTAAREDGAHPRPFGPREAAVTAETVSPAAGRRYGVARVCRAWDVPRSSFYAARTVATRPPVAPAQRGPKPAVSDADLLAAVRADLARLPWSGEGHRKLWARLRVLDGTRVARKRVLRLMREHALLSPHLSQGRPAETHDRNIVTDAPHLMWAADASPAAARQRWLHQNMPCAA